MVVTVATRLARRLAIPESPTFTFSPLHFLCSLPFQLFFLKTPSSGSQASTPYTPKTSRTEEGSGQPQHHRTTTTKRKKKKHDPRSADRIPHSTSFRIPHMGRHQTINVVRGPTQRPKDPRQAGVGLRRRRHQLSSSSTPQAAAEEGRGASWRFVRLPPFIRFLIFS